MSLMTVLYCPREDQEWQDRNEKCLSAEVHWTQELEMEIVVPRISSNVRCDAVRPRQG